MKGWPSTEISRRVPPVVPMRAERKLSSASDFFDFRNVVDRSGDEHGGGGLGEEAEERMNHQRLVLLDRGADAFAEGGLSECHSDAAVGDVAGGME